MTVLSRYFLGIHKELWSLTILAFVFFYLIYSIIKFFIRNSNKDLKIKTENREVSFIPEYDILGQEKLVYKEDLTGKPGIASPKATKVLSVLAILLISIVFALKFLTPKPLLNKTELSKETERIEFKYETPSCLGPSHKPLVIKEELKK